MIKAYCDPCGKEVELRTTASLMYVKIKTDLEGKMQQVPFDTHLCDSCLEKALKAMEKKK